jgi:hypothetical protein
MTVAEVDGHPGRAFDQGAHLLLRSPLALAARIEREHQWTAASVHAEGNRSLQTLR